MSNIPSDLRYTRSHEWVRQLEAGQIEFGITDHAQSALGDLVYVDVPGMGAGLSAGTTCAVIESVKAASDVYSPVTGKVIAGNADLSTQPELVNQDPYGKGWLLRVQLDAAATNDELLTPAEYEKFVTEEK